MRKEGSRPQSSSGTVKGDPPLHATASQLAKPSCKWCIGAGSLSFQGTTKTRFAFYHLLLAVPISPHRIGTSEYLHRISLATSVEFLAWHDGVCGTLTLLGGVLEIAGGKRGFPAAPSVVAWAIRDGQP